MSQWDQIPDSIADELQQTRSNRAAYLLGIVVALFHLWFNSFATLSSQTFNILHFSSFVLLCGLLYPLKANRSWRWLDLLFTLSVALGAIYLIFAIDAIYQRDMHLAPLDWMLGVLVIIGAIECVRRTTGWIIPLLIIFALSYITWWGSEIPGVFRFAGLSVETVLFRSLFGDDALFGSIAHISATFVFIFILFGAFLLRSGAGDFVVHLSRAVAGRIVGGPGIVAVIGSGLTGTISGSAIANTASTGVITIPMMKKAGFPARFAAGVEAAASTGGQLMPPIMGAGAFVMASYTQIPYATIVAVSIIPALLYFLSLAFYVRFEAYKQGITKTQHQQEPLLPLLFSEGLAFIIPVTLLIALLASGFTPVYAGAIAIMAVVISSWFTPSKMGIRAIFDALAMGARNMVTTALLLCAVGLIVNVIATAGIGNTFSLMIIDWANGSLLIAILLVAFASLILGMGLPVTASYIVLATLSAPALFDLMANMELISALTGDGFNDQTKMIIALTHPDILQQSALTLEQATQLVGSLPLETIKLLQPMLIDQNALMLILLSAHLIIFWLSQDSNVTPPVCLCTFTAAAIAKTKPMATGLTSWKIAKALYIIPVLFAYTPLITGDWLQRLEVGLFGLFGLYAFISAIQGWGQFQLTMLQRGVLALLALGLLWPLPSSVHLSLCVILLFFSYWLNRHTNGPYQHNE